MARKKTKSYPESFRKEAVRLADLPDRTAVDVAKELGLHVGQIYNWRTQFSKLSKGQFKVHEGVDYSKDEKEEIRRLKRENAKLRKECDFLKKATAYFAKSDE
jgi:transposase